jgi:hypothetical protein
MERDPFTLRGRLDQNLHLRTATENGRQPIQCGHNAAVEHFTIRRHNPNLAFLFV